MKKWSLKAKILAGALGLTIIPALVIGGVCYLGTQSLKTQLIENRQDTETAVLRELSVISVVSGATALISAAIAVALTHRLLRPVLRASQISSTLVNRLRQDTITLRPSEKTPDGLTSLETNLNLIAQQLPDLLWKKEAADEPFQVLMTISRHIWESFSEENVLKTTVEEVRQILKTDRVVIFRFDNEWEGTFIAESVAPIWPKTLWATINDPCFEQDYTQMYQDRLIHVINDIYQAQLSDAHIGLLERFAVKASLIAPIFRENKRFGLLIAQECSNPRTWQQIEINLLAQIADQVGFALDHAKLLQQVDRAAEQTQIFTDITLRLRESLREEDVLTTTVEEVRKALKADRVIVYCFDCDWYGTVVAESVVPGFPKALWAKIKDPCFAEGYVESYQEGRIHVLDNIYEAGLTECYLQQLEPFAVKANLVAPILKDEKLFGLLIAHQCSAPRNWQQSEIDLFAQIATQVGFALDHARLLAQVEQAYESAHLVSQQQHQQQETLQHILSETIGKSQPALKNLSTEALTQMERVSATYNQIRETVNAVEDRNIIIQQAERQQQQVKRMVQSCCESINQLLENISTLQNTFIKTAEKFNFIEQPSRKLSEVVGLINKIVPQVKLQALSAELEASRLGAGDGELISMIKKTHALAEQLEAEFSQILPLIAEIQGQTDEISTTMKRELQQLNSETELVGETRLLSDQITHVNSQVTHLMEEIAQSTIQDRETLTQVSQSVLTMANFIRQTSEQSRLLTDSFQKIIEVQE